MTAPIVFSDDELTDIRRLYSQGASISMIARKYVVSRQLIYRALGFKNYQGTGTIKDGENMAGVNTDYMEKFMKEMAQMNKTLSEILYILKECDIYVRVAE